MARSSAGRVRSKEQASSASEVAPEGTSVQRSAPSSRKAEQKGSAERPGTSVHPVEPPSDQDAARDAGSPSRQVLRMNTEGGQAQRPKNTPAGQHATGSFTGSPRGGRKKSNRKAA